MGSNIIMKEVTEKDIAKLKMQSYVFRRDLINNPDLKDPNWVDKLNAQIVDSYNFEQRLIDLINKELEEKPKQDAKSKKG